ncbi:MAG: GNAT family N-acetyltransferase [Vampirovibrionales bacterium]
MAPSPKHPEPQGENQVRYQASQSVSSHVRLRALEPEDLPRLQAWRNEPSLRQYFREYRALNTTMQDTWFQEQACRNTHISMWGIVAEDLPDAPLIGACGLVPIHWVHRAAELSIYIGYEHLNIDTHYAPEALKHLIAYAFHELNLHRLWAEVYTLDTQKEALYRTAGFTQEGSMRDTYWHHGQWWGSTLWSLLSTDVAPVNEALSMKRSGLSSK